MLKRLFFVAVVVLFVVSGRTSAMAHYVFEEVIVWEGPSGYCLEDRAEISDGRWDDGYEGYTKVDADTWKPISGINCFYQWNLSQDRIRVFTELQYFNCSQWVWCTSLPWKYNPGVGNEVEQAKYWGPKCTAPYSAWYGVFGHAGVYLYEGPNGEGWYGGYQWSGSHWLAAHPN